MIDARTQKLIELYIPNPRDPDLHEGAYYLLQHTMGKPRILTVYPLDILPCDDGCEYGIYQKKGGHLVRIDVGYGTPLRGIRMSYLYDNKQDCKHQTHFSFDGWESLRKLQREERDKDE